MSRVRVKVKVKVKYVDEQSRGVSTTSAQGDETKAKNQVYNYSQSLSCIVSPRHDMYGTTKSLSLHAHT